MMFYLKDSNIYILILCILLITELHKTNGYPNDKEATFPTNDVYGEVDNIKINLRKINFELDSLHNNLHLQTDLITGIRNEIIHKDIDRDQCDTDELFNNIDSKLTKIKQNLMKTINENDDKHLDKMDSIMHKVKLTKSCVSESNNEDLEEIKTKISTKLQKLDEYAKRLEELQTSFAKLDKPADQEIVALKTTDNKLTDLESMINEINLKLSSQADKFHSFEESLRDMRNLTSIVEDYLNKKNKQRMRCSHTGKCMLYNLIALDKSYNLTRIKTS